MSLIKGLELHCVRSMKKIGLGSREVSKDPRSDANVGCDGQFLSSESSNQMAVTPRNIRRGPTGNDPMCLRLELATLVSQTTHKRPMVGLAHGTDI